MHVEDNNRNGPAVVEEERLAAAPVCVHME
jgi:hypothetical protein